MLEEFDTSVEYDDLIQKEKQAKRQKEIIRRNLE
jgi:hypothetical protein